MTSLPERTMSLSARITERPRELQEVSLIMIDGTEVRGMLHRMHGSRTVDFLNCQTEDFVAMTEVSLQRGEKMEHLSFIAINKAHVMRVSKPPTMTSC
jgi:hypothetical protein